MPTHTGTIPENHLRVVYRCNDTFNRLVLNGSQVDGMSKGGFWSIGSKVHTHSHSVTVDDGNTYTVTFTANFENKKDPVTGKPAKTLTVEGHKDAIERFHLKSSIKFGYVETHDGKRTVLAPRAWETIDPTQRCHEKVLTYLKPWADDDRLYFQKPRELLRDDIRRYRYYDHTKLAYASVREKTTTLSNFEIKTILRENITRQMVKAHRKELEDLLKLQVSTDFKPRKYRALFNCPDPKSTREGGEVLHLGTGETDVQTPLESLGNELELFHKYQEVARILIANEMKLEALEYMAEHNAKVKAELGEEQTEQLEYGKSGTIGFNNAIELGDPFETVDEEEETGYPTRSGLSIPDETSINFITTEDPKKLQEAKKRELEEEAKKQRELAKNSASRLGGTQPATQVQA